VYEELPPDPDPDRDLAEAINLVSAVRNLNQAVDRLVTFAGARDLLLADANSAALNLSDGSSGFFGPPDVSARIRHLAYILNRARFLSLSIVHDRARDLYQGRDLGSGLGHSTYAGTRGDPIRDEDPDTIRELLFGVALSRTYASILSSGRSAKSGSSEDFGRMYGASFCNIVSISSADYEVLPDKLTQIMSDTLTNFQTRFADSDLPSSDWARWVIVPLATLAEAIMNRTESFIVVVPPLRFLALSLAAEADVREASELGDQFRHIAAGVTWLEQRHLVRQPHFAR
jgi:hypothetical protein